MANLAIPKAFLLRSVQFPEIYLTGFSPPLISRLALPYTVNVQAMYMLQATYVGLGYLFFRVQLIIAHVSDRCRESIISP